MSVDYHKHCQMTVLSANGTGNQNGATWDVINSASGVSKLPAGWKDKFKNNKANITEDIRSIL